MAPFASTESYNKSCWNSSSKLKPIRIYQPYIMELIIEYHPGYIWTKAEAHSVLKVACLSLLTCKEPLELWLPGVYVHLAY